MLPLQAISSTPPTFFNTAKASAGMRMHSLFACLEMSAGMPLKVITCMVLATEVQPHLPAEAIASSGGSGGEIRSVWYTSCRHAVPWSSQCDALCTAGASTAVAEAEAIASSTGRKLLNVARLC